MASFNSYTGNGVTQNRAITFPYLHTTHVHAYLDGVETEAWTWFDSSTIQFTVAPGNGVAILIQRETPTDERLAEFTNGEALLDEELNTAALQALYVAEEAKDRANQSIAVNALNRYDFGGRRATNAADPVDAQDLVTKTWAENNGSSVLAQTITAKNTALAAATAAEAAETGSEAAQDVAVAAAASADADATATAADRAAVAADKATVAADKGTVAADKAIVAADKATVAADKGTVAADKATVAADKATVAADKATVAADKATTQGYRDAALAAADEAEGYAASINPSTFLSKSGNLSGLDDLVTSRSNLGLGNAAVKDVGTAADTVAAGNDSRITGAVQKTGDETVAGVKTFSSIPVGPASDPTTANQLTRKSYVDAAVAGAGGQPIPTASNDLRVGYVGFFRVASGGTVTNDSTCAGSVLRLQSRDSTNGWVDGTTPAGTWKNISGLSVGSGIDLNRGWFVRTA